MNNQFYVIANKDCSWFMVWDRTFPDLTSNICDAERFDTYADAKYRYDEVIDKYQEELFIYKTKMNVEFSLEDDINFSESPDNARFIVIGESAKTIKNCIENNKTTIPDDVLKEIGELKKMVKRVRT